MERFQVETGNLSMGPSIKILHHSLLVLQVTPNALVKH